MTIKVTAVALVLLFCLQDSQGYYCKNNYVKACLPIYDVYFQKPEFICCCKPESKTTKPTTRAIYSIVLKGSSCNQKQSPEPVSCQSPVPESMCCSEADSVPVHCGEPFRMTGQSNPPPGRHYSPQSPIIPLCFPDTPSIPRYIPEPVLEPKSCYDQITQKINHHKVPGSPKFDHHQISTISDYAEPPPKCSEPPPVPICYSEPLQEPIIFPHFFPDSNSAFNTMPYSQPPSEPFHSNRDSPGPSCYPYN